MKKEILDEDIEKISDLSNDHIPRDKYFKEIWDTIEYKSPIGRKYYLRFFFSVFFLLFFIAIFFVFYSDFVSIVLKLEKMRVENNRYIPIIKNKNLKIVNKVNEENHYDGLIINNIDRSEYEFINTSKSSRVINLIRGHIRVNNKIDEGENPLIIICPDIKITIISGIADIFYYDYIFRITNISGNISYKTETVQEKLAEGKTLFFLERGKLFKIN